MKKDSIFVFLNRLIGKSATSRLYSRLKYVLDLKRYYSDGSTDGCVSGVVVYMIDGRVRHGGLSDRLRGLMTAYDYCKRSGRKLKINWTYPFKLEDYLHPNPDGPDWLIAPDEISYSKRDTDVRCLAGLLRLDSRPDIIDKVMDSDKAQIHYYSNNILDKTEMYARWFKELFVVDERIAEAVARCKAAMNNEPYVSVTLRFQSLLGDFFEGEYPVIGDDKEREELIDRCTAAVLKVQSDNPGKKVLVTSDSRKFLDHISKYEGVYVIDGDLVHMDYTNGGDYMTNMKSFVDMLMLMDADVLYGYHTGKMYESSGFFYTSALFGGKEAVFLSD